MSITQKIQTFAQDLSRLKENGKLAFRKCFDHNKFRKMFKRNGISTGKSTAHDYSKWNNRYIDIRTEWLFWNNPEYILIPEKGQSNAP